MRRPRRISGAIGIASFCHPRPIANHGALNGEISLGGTIAPFPGEQERVLDSVDWSSCALLGIVLQLVRE